VSSGGPLADPDDAGRATESERALEALLFVADEPMTESSLAQIVELPRAEVGRALERMAASYEDRASGLALRRVAGGWRLFTHPDVAAYVEQYVLSSRHARLTKASLETLAIVAYKQPVTRHQISGIRGVNSEGVLRSLVERELIQEVGRDDGPGRAALFGTTPEFLERLGLASLADLPPIGPLLSEAHGRLDGSAQPTD
jgi:segregation and condensation protein B